MENSTTYDCTLQAKLSEARKSMDTLKWRFSQLKALGESGSGSWSQFEDILEQMALVKTTVREVT